MFCDVLAVKKNPGNFFFDTDCLFFYKKIVSVPLISFLKLPIQIHKLVQNPS